MNNREHQYNTISNKITNHSNMLIWERLLWNSLSLSVYPKTMIQQNTIPEDYTAFVKRSFHKCTLPNLALFSAGYAIPVPTLIQNTCELSKVLENRLFTRMATVFEYRCMSFRKSLPRYLLFGLSYQSFVWYKCNTFYLKWSSKWLPIKFPNWDF